MMGRNEVVALQDRDVLRDVRPVLTPAGRTKEFFTPADITIASYRDKLKVWEDRGWRIDMAEVNRTRGRTAFAIPGPARRQQGGWVLDPVPLVPARMAAAATPTSGAREGTS
jgi:hypothetical protein